MSTEMILLYMLAAVLIVSAVGFIRTVYFVSIGYGFSIAAQAILLMVLHRSGAPILALVQNALLIIYGFRLSGYLVAREGKDAFKREAADTAARSDGTSFGKNVGIWIGVGVLYVMMAVSGMYHLRAPINGISVNTTLAAAGVAVMILGLGMESLADLQKSRYKKATPDRFCDTGLYRFVRCPNYLGEMIFWLGNLLAGASALKGTIPWVLVILGWGCITYIMLGSAQRLESRQTERYGDREDFQAWCSRTPVVIPFVPLYSLKNVKGLLT